MLANNKPGVKAMHRNWADGTLGLGGSSLLWMFLSFPFDRGKNERTVVQFFGFILLCWYSNVVFTN